MKEGSTISNMKIVTSPRPKVCPAPQGTKPKNSEVIFVTEEQFRQLTEEDIPCALFHVEPKDRDDRTGGRLDETILVGIIARHNWCLKYKPLQWFLDTYLISEEEWNKQKQKQLERLKKQ